jgi:hypothetical protein
VIVTVSLTPPSATLRIGATIQLNAAATASGSATNGALTFTSDNPAVVSISSAGLARALSIGTATVKASVTSGASATALVTVIAGLPASVTKSAGDNQTAQVASPLVIAPSVTVRDSAGNLLSGVPVAFAVASGGGSIAGGTATTSAIGVATSGTWTLGTSGTNTLAATVNGLPAVTFSATATPAPLGALTISAGDNQTAIAGTAVATAPSVLLTNGAGQPVAGVNVTFSVLSGGGSITGASAATNTAGIARAGTFTLGVAPGTNTLGASVAGLPSVIFSATGYAGPPTLLVIGTAPGGATTGALLNPQPIVQLRDANNGVVAGATNPVSVSLNGAGGALSGTQTVNAVNGVASFSDLRITGVGAYTLTFTSGTLPAVTSSSIGITTLPPTALGITTQPSGATSGAIFTTQPVIAIRDAGGSIVPGATSAVTATLNGTGGTLSGTTTVSAVNGTASFADLKVSGPGSYTLTFSSAGLTSVTSNNIVIAAVAPSQLVIGTAPGGATTGALLNPQPIVQLRDANNGVVAGATNPVSVSLNGAGGALSGTTTVNAVNGVASFSDLRITGVGSYTLTFTSGTLPAVTSSSIGITTLPPTALGITTQPSGATSGLIFTTQPVIAIRDAGGSTVSGATSAVTAAITGGNGTLAGTATVNAVNGVATFTDLKITGTGAQTLTFSSSGLTPASSTITLSAAPTPASVSFGTQQSTLLVGGASSTTATVKDASGNTLTGTALTYTSRTPGIATVGGTGAITGVAAGTSIIVVSVSPTIADSLLAIVMVPGGQVLVTNLNTFGVTQGSTITVSVFLDMTASTRKLASGSVRVNFTPATLTYVGTAAGAQFNPVTNEANVGTGILDVTFADPSGFVGLVEIAKVTFTVKTTVGATGAVALTSTELTASDFSNLLPTTTQVTRPIVIKP